ncbi:MAG: pyridoxamine 5'-phosphate oxidase family protein [Patescibacteria group bacterium]|jgi:predicted pyridoxine 5'-phosphate oxidase superfamily flavin-nucleotide-binding protein
MSWQNVFKKGQELILSTCTAQHEPHANIVISLGFHDDKLLVADAQMTTTIKNLSENRKICVVAKSDGLYYRIKGTVEIFNSGKYFNICVNADKNNPARNAILITVDEVFDLDNVIKII